MPGLLSFVLATASGIRGVPWDIDLLHPVGNRRIAPLGLESCMYVTVYTTVVAVKQ